MSAYTVGSGLSRDESRSHWHQKSEEAAPCASLLSVDLTVPESGVSFASPTHRDWYFHAIIAPEDTLDWRLPHQVLGWHRSRSVDERTATPLSPFAHFSPPSTTLLHHHHQPNADPKHPLRPPQHFSTLPSSPRLWASLFDIADDFSASALNEHVRHNGRLDFSAVTPSPLLGPPHESALPSPQNVDSHIDLDQHPYNLVMEASQHRRRPSSPPASAPQQPQQQQQLPAPQTRPLHAHIPASAMMPLRTNQSTPMSSPGLFSPTATRPGVPPPTSLSESNSPVPGMIAPYLHPLQTYKVRETHKALIESDNVTGRKTINQYEVIEEIGRGMHGKVKLARNVETGENVAIKIIPRFSKKRRLGKVMAMSPQDKTKKEIAILKKIRHPNVVALLEVIDDPELKKIYMVLEHAEFGEIIWRKKGLPHICQYERRRAEREMRGEPVSLEEERYDQLLEQRQILKEWKRARMAQNFGGPSDYWSVEHGAADEPSSSYGQQSRIASKEDFAVSDGPPSRQPSRGPSRSHSVASVGYPPSELDDEIDWDEDMETPGPLRSNPNSHTALDGTMYGPYVEERATRGRTPSMADSIISHMSSVDYYQNTHDAFADDFSYVPCFSLDHARATFRDTLLGLEYLHHHGVVHRDIKPANLLWSRDQRVKISDFGVSYFGRPIRDGEPDEPVSESEAKDFDDDVELSKTVGTPAFFAPELCYTDVGKEQPKVSEQIDVWSLGITLYCLVFARIPFLAEDEFQLFRKIATEEVHIPRRRLKPVDPSTSPVTTSLYKRHNSAPYRNDNDLEYEEVDPLLVDLFRQMLNKNPEKRIKLRDIKRHPWVIQGVSNPIGWLDDTDPGRPSYGKKIEVDDRDVSDAVVPLTFLERARSAVRKAVGKVIHPLVERSDSRRRATSSVASSAGDSMANGPPTAHPGAGDRRRSLMPDDYFLNLARGSQGERSSDSLAYDPMATVLPAPEVVKEVFESALPLPSHAGPSYGSVRSTLRHARSLSKPNSHTMLSKRKSRTFESHTTPSTPLREDKESQLGFLGEEVRQARLAQEEDSSRSRSVDRGLFSATDKRASPCVGVNTAVASGTTASAAPPVHPRPMRSVDLGKARNRYSLTSPLSSAVPQDDRPQSVHLDQRLGEPMQSRSLSKSPLPRKHTNSNPSSFINAQEAVVREQERDLERSTGTVRYDDPISSSNSPPSPVHGSWPEYPGPSRGNTLTTIKSTSTDSMEAMGMGTPLTSPSEVTSPIATTKTASEHFRSDPSLPALLSGASSVSNDMDMDNLNRPGAVSSRPSLLETTDSLTPPADMKEPTDGFPLGQAFEGAHGLDDGSVRLHLHPAPHSSRPPSNDGDDDDDGSDDGLLLMAKSKRKSVGASAPRRNIEPKRRDTNISTTSVETAKPIHPTEDDSPPQDA